MTALKSRSQEAHYHAQIGDISRQYEHAGRRWEDEDMKRLLVDAFRNETKDDENLSEHWKAMGEFRLVPAIGRDGFVVLGYQTRKFPKPLAAAFITWLDAFMVENQITTSKGVR